jgi:hypothetical protein
LSAPHHIALIKSAGHDPRRAPAMNRHGHKSDVTLTTVAEAGVAATPMVEE